MVAQLESRRILTLVFAPLILLLSHLGAALAADTVNPLTPADTSSPRATLKGFVEAVNTWSCAAKGDPQILPRLIAAVSLGRRACGS